MRRVWLIVGIGIVALAALVFWLAGERLGALAVETNQMRLTYLVILLVLVGSGLVMRWRDLRNLKWLQHGLIWVGLGLVLFIGFSFRGDMSSYCARLVAELMPGSAVEIDSGTVLVRVADDRQFYLDTKVDGTRIRFLVDTGATQIVLSHQDAAKIGFDMGKLAYTQRTQTANGIGLGAPVRLREIRVGPIVVKDIRASVNKAPMSTSLLGIAFLDRLSGYSVKDGTLTLKQ